MYSITTFVIYIQYNNNQQQRYQIIIEVKKVGRDFWPLLYIQYIKLRAGEYRRETIKKINPYHFNEPIYLH